MSDSEIFLSEKTWWMTNPSVKWKHLLRMSRFLQASCRLDCDSDLMSVSTLLHGPLSGPVFFYKLLKHGYCPSATFNSALCSNLIVIFLITDRFINLRKRTRTHETKSIYSHRITGGDRHHSDPHRLVTSGGPAGAGSSPPQCLQKQYETNRTGVS